MYANTSTPDQYRIAELRRNEEMNRAAERRRSKLLGPSQPGWFNKVRNLAGRGLIVAGQYIASSDEVTAQAQRPTAA